MKSTILAAVAAVLAMSVTPVMAQEATLNTTASDFSASTQMVAQLPASTTAVVPHKRMELTTDQLEKLHALKASYMAANGAKKAELRTLKGQLRDALTAVNVDKSAALSIQNKINSLQAELATSKVSLMADSSSIFTTEQREQMHRRALMRGMGGGKHHRGGGSCGGGGKGFHGGGKHHGRGHGGPGGARGAFAPGGPGNHFGPGGPGGPGADGPGPGPQAMEGGDGPTNSNG